MQNADFKQSIECFSHLNAVNLLQETDFFLNKTNDERGEITTNTKKYNFVFLFYFGPRKSGLNWLFMRSRFRKFIFIFIYFLFIYYYYYF